MKSISAFILAIALLNFIVDETVQNSASSFEWRNLETKYITLDEVRPVFVNKSDKTVYLDCNQACGCAVLKRYDEFISKWGIGNCLRLCNKNTRSGFVEIKPGQEIALNIYWKNYIDNCNKPRFFMTQEGKRPHPGKCKIMLECYEGSDPRILPDGKTYQIESPEFEIEF